MRTIALPLLSLALATVAGAQSIPRGLRPFFETPKNEIVRGQLLVKTLPSKARQLREFATSPSTTSLEAAIVPGGQVRSRIAQTGWTLWEIPMDADPRAVAAQVRKRPGVLHAQPVNKIYPLLTTPNDADWFTMETSETYILNFGEEDISFRRLWNLTDTFAHEGWSVWPNRYYTAANKPASAPLIAVIDTGNDMNHPDFRNAGGAGTNVTQGGQLVHALSKQFRYGELMANGTAMDSNGHGTHVAGLALAGANNGHHLGMGMLGTGYMSRGMILRVFDESGNGTDADAAAAMYYAADNGADVINLSLGTTNYSQLFQDATTYAFQKGSLVVAAANESGSGGGDLGPIYPAGCSGAFAVTANGPDMGSAANTYSGSGQYVDMAAPGGDVVQSTEYFILQYLFSTSPTYQVSLNVNPNVFPPFGQNYTYLLGTSMACPMVAGSASAWYDKHNVRQSTGWANIRAYQALQRAAFAVAGVPNGGWEPYQGYGNLDLESLLDPQYDNWRQATVGSIEGIVYFNGTSISNVAVRAQRMLNGAPTGITYSTTTKADGTYRFDQLPSFDGAEREYKVWASPFGVTKTRYTTVTPGADQSGFDFFCNNNGFTQDESNPVVVRHNLTPRSTYLLLDHFAYDPETGLESARIQVGTTVGGTNVLAPREIHFRHNLARIPVTLTDGTTYHVRTIYTNGDGDTTTVDRSFQFYQRAYDAEVVSADVLNDAVPAGQPVTFSVTVRNVGNVAWTWASNRVFRLEGTATGGPASWTIAPVEIPSNVSVPPGGTYTFNFSRTPPSQMGAWRVQWQMRIAGLGRSRINFFGDLSDNTFARVN